MVLYLYDLNYCEPNIVIVLHLLYSDTSILKPLIVNDIEILEIGTLGDDKWDSFGPSYFLKQ